MLYMYDESSQEAGICKFSDTNKEFKLKFVEALASQERECRRSLGIVRCTNTPYQRQLPPPATCQCQHNTTVTTHGYASFTIALFVPSNSCTQ